MESRKRKEVSPTTSVARREESMEAPISALGGAVFELPVKLEGLLRHGYMLPKGAEDEIPLIKHDLEEIIAILHDHISRLDYPSVMVNCWMKEVRELSYDIDDCIDQYEHAADSKSKYVCKIPRRKLTLCKTNRLSQKLKQRLWMANKIREFSVRVQEALQRHELYILGGIGRTIPPPPPIYDVPFRSPHHILYGEAADLVGIDAPMNKLEELLIKDGEQKLKAVSIVGVAGIGKTTLANEIYCKLGGQFDCRAFVRASQKPDMSRLLASILSQIRPHQPPDTWKVHNLIADIRTHLQDKRYLIVVDDAWATSTWDILNCTLPDNNICSRILVTTEIEDVAHKCCGYESKYVFRMKPLGDDDSRKLFFNSMFGSQFKCPPEFSEVSNNIIRKCGSLPLAIVTIARLLASQGVKLEQWDYVNKSLGYGLTTKTTLEGMKQVLNLSYNNLPSHLKACMLYLSTYEEDYIIWKDDLVKQWIAEGFLCSTEEQDKEEIFGSYFDELVSRRMIQPVRINDSGEVLSCVVHHMVLKLIAYKSIEENFVIAMDHSQTTTRFADKVRRLSLHFGNAEDAIPPTNIRLSQVRTLAFFGVFKCLPSIVEFRLLKILILHVWGDEESTSFDLTGISELFRLRYLQVTCNVTLELRTQMRGLQCLETLKIDARASAVPSDIVHLPSLLHLNLPAKTNLPNGIDHMTRLRTLGYFDLSGNSIENVQSLGELTNLQDLQLTCYTVQPDNLKNNMQCLGSILGKLSNLKSLTMVPAGGSSYVNILDVSGATSWSISGDGLSSLSSPPTLIQRLEWSVRVCIFSTVPKWIGHLGKLCILKIGVRELARSDVDVLRGLPALTVLSLYVHTKPAERVVFDKAGFSVLKYFKFKCSVAWLKFEAGAMPNLRKLKIGFNAHGADRYSTTMPVGIEHLSGLTEISAKIGSISAEEPDRRSAESALSETIKMHPGHPNVDIQCVDRIFGGKDDESMGALEDEINLWSAFTYSPAGAEKGFVTASNFVSSASSESQVTILDPIQGATSHKKRKLFSERSTQVRVSSVGSFLDDSFSWRKYYQQEVPGAKHPRSYYRCTHWSSQGCPATKQVQCTDGDPLLFDVVYRETHTCAQSTQPQPGQEQKFDSVRFNAEGDLLDSITTLDPIQGAAPRRRRISLRVVGAAVRCLIRMRTLSRESCFHMESANEGDFRGSLTRASAGTSTARRTSSALNTQGYYKSTPLTKILSPKFVGSKGELGISDHESSGTLEEEHMTLQTQWEMTLEDETNEQHGVLQKDYREDANKLTYISKLESFQGQIEGLRHEMADQYTGKLESLQRQIEGLRHEVKQLACMYSNRQADQYTRQESNHEHGAASGSNTSIRLCFLNDMKTPIYTQKNITDENNTAIKIGIFQDDTMITTGPLSKIKVEILVLRGEFSNEGRESWTEEEFNNYIVQGRDGQGFVLAGNCIVWLINGEASLGQLCFKEGSSRTRSRKFVVGARACKSEKTGVRIQEAVMKPVTVLDRSNEAFAKSHPPKLNDEVYRLENISKGGIYHKRLQKAHIFMVQDFLKVLNMDAHKLSEILQMKRHPSTWERMVRHAQECCLEGRHELKRYQNEEGNVVLFFNCVYRLVGAAFHGNYITYDELNLVQKTVVHKLKAGAYNYLESIPFDYVMKGKFPEPIFSSTNSAAGSSIQVRGASQQEFSADHFAVGDMP